MTIKIRVNEEAYLKLVEKCLEWGYQEKPKSFSWIILALINSQEQLQKCYWDLIKGNTTLEQERKRLHWNANK